MIISLQFTGLNDAEPYCPTLKHLAGKLGNDPVMHNKRECGSKQLRFDSFPASKTNNLDSFIRCCCAIKNDSCVISFDAYYLTNKQWAGSLQVNKKNAPQQKMMYISYLFEFVLIAVIDVDILIPIVIGFGSFIWWCMKWFIWSIWRSSNCCW